MLVWVSLEGLPVHLHDRQALYSVAKAIGQPIRIDAATLALNRPSVT